MDLWGDICPILAAIRIFIPPSLHALQVSAEAGVPLDSVLDAVRATAPTSASSPCKDVDSKLPLSARARGRPRSAGPGAQPAGGSRPASPPLVGAAAGLPAKPAVRPCPAAEALAASAALAGAAAAGDQASTPGFGCKLEQRVLGLQALLDFEEADLDSILAHPGSGAAAGGPAAPAAQPAAVVEEEGTGGERAQSGPGAATVQSNPTFQVSSRTMQSRL